MSIFVLRRILTLAATLVGASLIIFLVLDALPGNAAQMLMGADASPDAVRALTVKLGLDQPLLYRYLHWIQGMTAGDLGNSYVYGTPVVGLIAERLTLTIPLAIMSMLITVALALAAGIYAAANHNRIGDVGVMSLTQIGIALPNFWFAILLILLFAVNLRWLPSSGAASPQSIILPAIVAGAYSAAGLTRLLRSSLLEVMANDYMRTARGKGLPTRVVVLRHALKNAAIPVVAFLGVQIAFLFGNTVIAEAIFAYPGMSRLAVDAISARDTPVIQVFVLLAGTLVVLVNLIADVAYAWLDPRIRLA